MTIFMPEVRVGNDPRKYLRKNTHIYAPYFDPNVTFCFDNNVTHNVLPYVHKCGQNVFNMYLYCT
jgi:hypothetical protein